MDQGPKNLTVHVEQVEAPEQTEPSTHASPPTISPFVLRCHRCGCVGRFIRLETA